MSGMPLFDALLLLISVVVLVATPWRRLHPFLAIVAVATGFGLTAGFTIAVVGKAFGSGFAQAITSPGLVIVAAGLVWGLAEATGAAGWFAALAARWRSLGSTWFAAPAGLIAGLAATPSTAFAVLTPLLRATGSEAAPATRHHARPLTLALAISASHGLLLVSPVPIAAASILDAAWSRVFLFGLPLAVLSVVVGTLWAHWLSAADVTPQATTPTPPAAMGKPSAWSATVLLVATIVPLLLLMVQSLGDIPSEPLGGGMAREAVIGVGRPLVLLVGGVGIMVIGNLRLGERLLTDAAWTTRILGNVAGPLLTVGAAGGLQRLCQETGMAELLGERLTGWHITGFAALLMAFLIAATIKTSTGLVAGRRHHRRRHRAAAADPAWSRRRQCKSACGACRRRRRHDGLAHQRRIFLAGVAHCRRPPVARGWRAERRNAGARRRGYCGVADPRRAGGGGVELGSGPVN